MKIGMSLSYADDSLLMLTGVIPVTEQVLAKTKLSLDDIDACEGNEAFAPVPLAWAKGPACRP